MQKLFTAGVAFTIAASLACGKSDVERQAEEAASANMAKGMEDFAKPMSGMAGALGGDGKAVEPVTFESL